MVTYIKNSKKSGIYQIRNLINNIIYVGSASLLGNRKWQHFNQLILNNHPNKKLQNAFNKYGRENFIFEVLELCEKENLIHREQYYLNILLCANVNNTFFNKRGYNILRIAKNSVGFKHSEETKKKISEIQIGKKVSQKVKDLLYYYSKDRIVSEETREKSRLAKLGFKHTEETKEKLRQINIGKKFSKEHVEKIINAQIKPVILINITINTIITFSSYKDCAKYLNISKGYVSYLIKNQKIFKKIYKLKNKNE